MCAAARDRFWEYHDLAYENQGRLSHESPREFARVLELDEGAFIGCVAGGAEGVRATVIDAYAPEGALFADY